MTAGCTTMTEESYAERVRARATAILAGVALPFVVFLPLNFVLGFESPLLWPMTVMAYALAGAALGFFWPRQRWRLGVWLFAVWPPLLVLAALFSDGPLLGPAGWKGLLQDLAAYSLMLVASCLGAEAGAVIGRRQGRQPAAAKD